VVKGEDAGHQAGEDGQVKNHFQCSYWSEEVTSETITTKRKEKRERKVKV
jgi:hypothetical protein